MTSNVPGAPELLSERIIPVTLLHSNSSNNHFTFKQLVLTPINPSNAMWLDNSKLTLHHRDDCNERFCSLLIHNQQFQLIFDPLFENCHWWQYLHGYIITTAQRTLNNFNWREMTRRLVFCAEEMFKSERWCSKYRGKTLTRLLLER